MALGDGMGAGWGPAASAPGLPPGDLSAAGGSFGWEGWGLLSTHVCVASQTGRQ